jgi:cytochrome c biogenesis factor
VIVVGELALWVSLFLAIWGGIASFGAVRLGRPDLLASGARSIVASAAMVALACAGVWTALARHDFSLQYVAANTTVNTPTVYLITAFWAGPPGKMLFFGLSLSIGATIIVARARSLDIPHAAWLAGSLATLLGLVLLSVCFGLNPYDRIEWVPAEGEGLDPRLQTPLAALYFIATYAAYGAAAVPFAIAAAGTITRSLDLRSLTAVRGWTYATWWLLTMSIVVRMRWTYLEALTGGLWQSDVAQATNVAAWTLAFALASAFAVRSLPPSPRSTATIVIALFGVALAGAATIPRPPGPPDGETEIPKAALLWLTAFGVVAAGVIHTSVRRLPAGRGRAEQRGVNLSVGVLVVSIGAVGVIAGVVASKVWSPDTVNLRPGQAAPLADPYGRRWRFVSQGPSRDEGMNYMSTGVAVEAWRDRKHVGIISAERRQYVDGVQRPIFEPRLKPGIRSTLLLDVYLVLRGIRGEFAELSVGFRPLVSCVWIGWLVIATGMLALAPGLTRRSASA